MKIDGGDSAWEAEAARVADVTPLYPAVGAPPECDFFPADSAGAQLRSHGDVKRGTVINWCGRAVVHAIKRLNRAQVSRGW